jgi:hypothetical protein
LNKITPYKIAMAAECIRRWECIGLSTDPIDRPAAEEAIRRLRSFYTPDLPKNPLFIWTRSPESFNQKMEELYRISPKQIGRRAILVSFASNDFGFSYPALYSASPTTHDSIKKLNQKILHAFMSSHQTDYPLSSYTMNMIIDQEVFDLKKRKSSIEAQIEVARTCGHYLNHENAVIMSERPTILSFDGQSRLHSMTGPAIAYGDKYVVYKIHGITLKEDVIINPLEALTVKKIDNEHNAEVKRVLMDLYGYENYLRQSGAVKIHEGKDGRKLWWRIPEDPLLRDHLNPIGVEPLVMVEVKNSTPEPDGTFKTYFLRVSPHLRDADEAVASTFGMTKDEYEPLKET